MFFITLLHYYFNYFSILLSREKPAVVGQPTGLIKIIFIFNKLLFLCALETITLNFYYNIIVYGAQKLVYSFREIK